VQEAREGLALLHQADELGVAIKVDTLEEVEADELPDDTEDNVVLLVDDVLCANVDQLDAELASALEEQVLVGLDLVNRLGAGLFLETSIISHKNGFFALFSSYSGTVLNVGNVDVERKLLHVFFFNNKIIKNRNWCHLLNVDRIVLDSVDSVAQQHTVADLVEKVVGGAGERVVRVGLLAELGLGLEQVVDVLRHPPQKVTMLFSACAYLGVRRDLCVCVHEYGERTNILAKEKVSKRYARQLLKEKNKRTSESREPARTPCPTPAIVSLACCLFSGWLGGGGEKRARLACVQTKAKKLKMKNVRPKIAVSIFGLGRTKNSPWSIQDRTTP